MHNYGWGSGAELNQLVYLIYLRPPLPVRSYSNFAVAGWVHYALVGWKHSRVPSWASPAVLAVA